MSGAPPPPERWMPTLASQMVAFLLVGALGGALGAVLMSLEEGVAGHGHGGGGNVFAMLPHQILLAAPLAILVILFARETRTPRVMAGMLLTVLGIALVDLWLA